MLNRIRSQSGFTLIELLVVIGIMAILLGFLLPALFRGQAAARKITCAANLQQIAIGLQMYANVNRSWFPYPSNNFYAPWVSFGLHPPTTSYNDWCMLGQLYRDKYIPDPHAFYCPSANTDVIDPHTYENRWGPQPNEWTSASYSYRIFAAPDTGLPLPYRAHNKGPATTSVVTDIQVNYDTVGRNHKGGSNVLFGDGHVVWIQHRPDAWLYSSLDWDKQPTLAWAFFDKQ